MVSGLDHVGLLCADLDASVSFYRDALGLDLRDRGVSVVHAADTAGERFAWADLVVADGTVIELIQYLDREAPAPGGGHFAFRVPDIAAALERLAAVGVRPLNPPHTLTEPGAWHGTTIAFVLDPNGHRVELVQPRPE